MILKIIADHGTHYRDGAENVAIWKDELGYVIAKYVGGPPEGGYTFDMTGPTCQIANNIIAFHWPKHSDDMETKVFDEMTSNEAIRTIHISYHNSKGASGEQEELFVDERCTVYLMSDEGKTIERLV